MRHLGDQATSVSFPVQAAILAFIEFISFGEGKTVEA
jgi:hypothetical protein